MPCAAPSYDRGIINRVVFSFADRRQKAPVVMIIRWLFRLLTFPLCNKVSNPWVLMRCSTEIAQLEDVLIFANRETFNLSEFRVFEFFTQQCGKVFMPSFVTFKLQTKVISPTRHLKQSLHQKVTAARFARTTFVLNKLSCLLIFISCRLVIPLRWTFAVSLPLVS